jgi:hypothetical protein
VRGFCESEEKKAKDSFFRKSRFFKKTTFLNEKKNCHIFHFKRYLLDPIDFNLTWVDGNENLHPNLHYAVYAKTLINCQLLQFFLALHILFLLHTLYAIYVSIDIYLLFFQKMLPVQ